MEEHLEHVVEECRGFPYARAKEMAIPVLQDHVRRHGGDDRTKDKEELIRRLQACFQENVSRPLPGDALATPPWWDKPKPQRVFRSRAAYLGWSGHERLPWASSRSRSRSQSRSRSRDRSPRRSARDSPPLADALPNGGDLLAAATTKLSLEAAASSANADAAREATAREAVRRQRQAKCTEQLRLKVDALARATAAGKSNATDPYR